MTERTTSAQLREEILAKVREYYEAEFAEKPPFEPGDSRVPYAARVFDERELVNLVDSSLDFWLTYGRYSRDFEKGLAEYLGIKTALLVNSGSSANLLAFAALTSEKLGDRRITRGDEVITVAAGFPTTVAPIVQFGAVPVFVDVVLGTYNIDVTQLDAALSSRTKAVMLAHTLGNPFDIDAVRAFCDANGLWLIEDNCDALGGDYRGRKTGTFGDIGTSSFYPPHHMTMGEGGAVYTDDDTLAGILLSMRDWGRDCYCPSGKDNSCGKRFSQQFGTLPFGYDHKYVYSEFGYNLKVSDMQAAVGVAQLEKLPSFADARRRNYARLRYLVAPVEDVLIMPEPTEGADPSWFGYLMTVREGAPVTRDQLVAALEAAKVQTRMLFAGNMVRQPVFDSMRESGEGYRTVGDLPNTDRIMNDAFWIGVYPGMTDEMLGYMAEVIIKTVRGLTMAPIRFEETAIPGLLVIKPQVVLDERGSFTKTFVAEPYAEAGLATTFAEEYRTRSGRGVVRGMHFQMPPHDHEKLVFCTDGVVMDVILDLRRGSRTFGQTLTFALEGPTGFGLYIPVGCAHGFCGLSDESTMEYRVSGAYSPEHDAGVLWSSVDVEWPFEQPVVSARDAGLPALDDFDSPFTLASSGGPY